MKSARINIKVREACINIETLDIQVREGSGPWEEYSSDMMSDAEHDDLLALATEIDPETPGPRWVCIWLR